MIDPNRPLTKSELAGLYKVSRKTLNRWLEKYKEKIGIDKSSKYLTVKQLQKIYQLIGRPDLLDNEETN